MIPTFVVPAGRFRALPRLIVPAEKLPTPSLLTTALALLELVALSPSVTAPLSAVTVMSALPVIERMPVLVSVTEPPSGTPPPPLRPGPVLTTTELFANWLLLTVPAMTAWPSTVIPAPPVTKRAPPLARTLNWLVLVEPNGPG